MSDEERIRQVVADWLAASRAGDIDKVLGLMTDDAVFLVPGRAPMSKSDFAAASRPPAGMALPKIDSESHIEEVIVDGDLAVMRSRLRVVMTPAGGAAPIERAGHTLTVFRRQEGRWLLARDANLLSVVSGRSSGDSTGSSSDNSAGSKDPGR